MLDPEALREAQVACCHYKILGRTFGGFGIIT